MPIKYKTNPAQFLCDSGILFEINRTVMHPLGLALAIVYDPEEGEGEGAEIRVWDRTSEEGYTFGREDMADGLGKIAVTRANSTKVVERRKELLGYVVQGKPERQTSQSEADYDDWGSLDGS